MGFIGHSEAVDGLHSHLSVVLGHSSRDSCRATFVKYSKPSESQTEQVFKLFRPALIKNLSDSSTSHFRMYLALLSAQV